MTMGFERAIIDKTLESILSGVRRERELLSERDEDLRNFIALMNTESLRFVRRVESIDVGSERDQYYDLLDDARERFADIRDRDEIRELPVDAVIALENFIETMENARFSGGAAGWGTEIHWTEGTPREEAERRQQKKKRRNEFEEQRRRDVKKITNKLGAIYDSMDKNDWRA